MLFLGNAFLGAKYSGDPTITHIPNITFIKIMRGIYDSLYLSSDPVADVTDKKWDFSTLIWANFRNNLYGGNVEASLRDITSVKIKRRRTDGFDWITLTELPVYGIESFRFEYFDRYVSNKTEYQYALVFMSAKIEGQYNTNIITPEFSGLFVLDREYIYYSFVEHYVPQIEQNHSIGVIPTIEKRYPFYVAQTKNNYVTGSVSGVFVKSEECELDFEGIHKYQKGLLEWLADGGVKIIKYYNGESWLAVVSDNPRRAQEANTDKYTVSFSFAEIGDVESEYDLWENGFIDAYGMDSYDDGAFIYDRNFIPVPMTDYDYEGETF